MKIPDNWKFLGSGRHRDAYRLPSGNVIKVPRYEAGIAANHFEAMAWKFRNRRDCLPNFFRKSLRDIVPARCRLIPGTDLLVMEYVSFMGWQSWRFDLPAWCYLVDSGQFGLNKRGEVVAFDFANWLDAYNSLAIQTLLKAA